MFGYGGNAPPAPPAGGFGGQSRVCWISTHNIRIDPGKTTKQSRRLVQEIGSHRITEVIPRPACNTPFWAGAIGSVRLWLISLPVRPFQANASFFHQLSLRARHIALIFPEEFQGPVFRFPNLFQWIASHLRAPRSPFPAF